MNNKDWFKAGYVDKIDLAISLYPELSLNSEYFLVVLTILWFQKDKVAITIDSLMKQTKLSKDKINKALHILSENEYLKISTTGGKVEFSLDGLFNAQDKTTVFDEDLFSLFEQEFGRVLSANEVEMLATFIKGYTKNEIIIALRSALIYNKKNMNYIAKILINKQNEKKSTQE